MKAQRFRWSTGLLMGMLVLIAVTGRQAAAQSQKMAIPSYFYPGKLWTKLEEAAPTLGLAIINPNSGPGEKIDPAYVAQVKELKAHHITVLGYVHTSYTKRPFDEVKSESAQYFQWYKVDGIFFDEVSNTKAEVPYYAQCHDMARSLKPRCMVVLNPGTQTDEAYMAVCDILTNYESGLDDYLHKYDAPAWVAKYPARRFWHIVLRVESEADMQAVIKLTKQRNAGWVYVTPLGDPNPYDKLPDDPYWSDLLAALRSK
jgi:putative cell wall-binding protein